MKSIRLDIPHIRQPKGSAKCGAACLAMIYQYHQHPMQISDIWPYVKGPGQKNHVENCRIPLMLRHAAKQNFIALGVSVDDPLSLIHTCLSNNIDVIPLYTAKNGCPHFSVITGFDETCLYLNDPDQPATMGKNRRIGNQAFLRSFIPPEGSDIGRYSPFILLGTSDIPTVPATVWCPGHNAIMEVDVFSVLRPFKPMLVCPDHGCWSSKSTFQGCF